MNTPVKSVARAAVLLNIKKDLFHRKGAIVTVKFSFFFFFFFFFDTEKILRPKLFENCFVLSRLISLKCYLLTKSPNLQNVFFFFFLFFVFVFFFYKKEKDQWHMHGFLLSDYIL